jgi:hypothetical protein
MSRAHQKILASARLQPATPRGGRALGALPSGDDTFPDHAAPASVRFVIAGFFSLITTN